MLHLIIGKDWVAIRENILGRISDDVAAQRGGRILIVPELISHDTERRLCAAAGDTASRYAEVLTFTRLAQRVSQWYGQGGISCLDQGGRVVAMAAAAQQLSGRLKAYAAVETKPEFLTGMIDAVDEFKRCRISARDLTQAAAASTGAFAQKLEELALLMDSYDGICSRGKRDPREREEVLLEQLLESDYAQRHVFYVDGFPDLTCQHMAILEHLLQHSPDVYVGINTDALNSKKMAFEKASETATMLIRLAKQQAIAVEIEEIPSCHKLQPVCDALFQGPVTERMDQGLDVFSCESVFDEVTCAAEQIVALIQGGCRFRDIGIVFADPATYINALKLIFARFGIPLYCTGKEDVLQMTLIHTVVCALEAVVGEFERTDVLRYMKSVLSPVEPELCDKMENYALLWGIRSKMWTKPWEKNPRGLSGDWNSHTLQQLQELENGRKLVMQPLLKLRDGIFNAANLSEQILALYRFLEEIDLETHLQTLSSQLCASGDLRQVQILDQLWEILVESMEQLYGVLGSAHWDAENFCRLFELLLSQYEVGTIPPVLDSVYAGTAANMRCHQTKYLFILGAAEGALPGYSGSTGILSDQERIALRSLGVPLTGGAMEGVQAEFAEIYGVFCGAREKIWISCDGSQPSYIWRRLAQLCGQSNLKKPGAGAALTNRCEAAGYLYTTGQTQLRQTLALQDEYDALCARLSYDLGSVSAYNIRQLYGQSLTLSASQVDRQAECRMSYFLKYGLRAKECKEATVDPAEFGTYVHYVLEGTARDVMALGGFEQVSLQQTMQIAMTHSDAYTQTHFSQVESARIQYLFHRNSRELEMVVSELWQELKESRFRPVEFELQFGAGGKMDAISIPACGINAVLRGFVDRVDVWNTDGRKYFRVVDYKTGKKDFDYCDVFNGVGLQMLLYLYALEQGGLGTAAGVQYFPARAPLISAEGTLSDEDAQILRGKEWKRRGLLLCDAEILDAMDANGWNRLCAKRLKDGSVGGDVADREQLRKLRKYVFSCLGRLVDDIASGNVQPNPYRRGTSHDACAFCPYGSICRDRSEEGCRNYKMMTADRFWEEIAKEVD